MADATDVDVEAVNWERIAQAVNDGYFKTLALENKIRDLEMRIDNIVPTTINTTVLRSNKTLIIGIAVASAGAAWAISKQWPRWKAEAIKNHEEKQDKPDNS